MRDERRLYANNNFDLIRLIAAAQVVVIHAVQDLHVTALKPLADIIGYFPGVPAFFFISGFLIKAAWERNPDVRVFYMNRAYRILPALWASVIVAVITLFIFFDRGSLIAHGAQLVVWMIGQATVGQAWTPGFLKPYGIGAVNGSLWTIPVELAFYLTIPAMARIFARAVKPIRILPILIAASFALNYLIILWMPGDARLQLAQKLVIVSPVPWLGMFFMGMLAQDNIDKLYEVVAGRIWVFLAIFVAVSILSAMKPVYPWLSGPDQVIGGGNRIGVANYLSLCLLVLSAAYSYRSVSDRLLARNDLSYGIYIAHGLVLNALVQVGLLGLKGLSLAIPITVAVALVSWFTLEKPMLARRKASLYQHEVR